MADQNNGQYAATAVPPPAIEATRITRAQWLVLAAAFLGWMFDGVEIGLFPLVARPALAGTPH